MDITINHDNKSGLVSFNSQSHVNQVLGVSWWQDKAMIELGGDKNDNGDFQLVTIPCICCSHVSYCSLACRQLAKGDLSFHLSWLPFFLPPPPWQTITKKIIFPSQRPTTNMNAELETSWRPSPDRKPRGTSADFASEWVRGKCLFSFSDFC